MTRPAIVACMALLLAAAAQGQPTRQAVEGMSMWPPFIDVTTELYPGIFTFYEVGATRGLDGINVDDPHNWNWLRYTNPQNIHHVAAMAFMGDPKICSHGHISYGLWGRWRIKINGLTLTGWKFLGGGAQSGEMVNGSCKWDVNNSWVKFSQDFGWGTNYIDYVSAPSANYTEFVMGVIGVSHFSQCPQGFYCGHPMHADLWTLPF